MSKLALVVAFGLALAVPAVATVQAEPNPNKAVTLPQKPETPDLQKISNKVVRLCYTCGGATPIRRLTINLNGTGNRTLEYGSGCGGPIQYFFDNNPYLCSN
jgi:hypothetical protein